jgi:hypothetical protein
VENGILVVKIGVSKESETIVKIIWNYVSKSLYK